MVGDHIVYSGLDDGGQFDLPASERKVRQPLCNSL
jgi:hypothetical protein